MIYKQGLFEGERALYHIADAEIIDSTFQNGESPLKECDRLKLDGCIFKWKYPLWYSRDVHIKATTLLETARSGIWYTHGISMENCTIEAPKTFRRSTRISLTDCTLPDAKETLWNCRDVRLKNVSAAGDYFAMGSENVDIDGFSLKGNYAFDGAKNVTVKNARLLSKDSFWNCENVTVENSLIIGEYLAWNSKNVTFINCTIDSNQGLCYLDNVKLVNCKLLNTDLCFELSTVDAEVTSKIDSVKNPISGSIRAAAIGELILDEKLIDPKRTKIVTDEA